MNTFLDKFLHKTVWIWLPFYAFYRLTKELLVGREQKPKDKEAENF